MKRTSLLVTWIAIICLLAMPSAFAAEHQSEGEQTGMMGSPSGQAGAGSGGPLRGSSIIGSNVSNDQGEDLGSVEDIVISQDGRVDYIILSQGGVFGMGDNLIPVPFSQVKTGADQEEGQLTLSVSQQELEQAPSFANNEWPDFSDPNYEDQVRGYYGEGGMQQQMDQQQQTEQYQQQDQMDTNTGTTQ